MRVADEDEKRNPDIAFPSAAVTDSPIDRLLGRLSNVQRTKPDQWMALCPAHADHNPSLSIRRTAGGPVLLHCFAGCQPDKVLGAINLTPADIQEGGQLEHVIATHATRLGGDVVATWTYTDPAGSDVFAVARFNTPRGKQYRPFHKAPGGWIIGDPPAPLPLYRLPDLADHERVFVVEGEKAADAAWGIGLPATTAAHGTQGARKTDWSPLAGREVVILPDADEPGRAYAQIVAEIVEKLNGRNS